MIKVTHQYRFHASHRLHIETMSDAENQELFGKCNNPHGHGHNYLVSIRVRGPIDADTGMAVDGIALDRLVSEKILSAFDHQYFNEDVQEFAHTPSTTENIAASMQRRLLDAWPAAFPGGWPKLDAIRVQETKRNLVELPIIEGTE